MDTVKRIKKMGKLAIIIILQLAFSLAIINTSSNTLLSSKKKITGLESLFDTNFSYLVRLIPIEGFENVGENFDFFEAFVVANDNYNVFDDLKKQNLIKNDYIYYPSIMPIKEINFDNVPKKFEKLSENKQADVLSKIVVNDNFLNKNNIKVYSGRTLTEEDTKLDYKKNNIPILIGKDLEENFSVGDIIKDRNFATINDTDDITFEVVGIMDDYAIPATNAYGDAFASSIILGNGFTVIPTVDNFLSLSYGAAIGDAGVILELNNGVKIDDIKNYLNDNFNKLGFKVEISSLGKFNNMILSLHKDHKASLLLGILLWALAMIGTSCLLMGIIKNRKKEFAIKLSVGASIDDIIKEFRFEILMISIISSVISIFISLGKIPSIEILVLNLLVVIFMVFVTTYLPIKYLKTMNLIDVF